MSCNGKDLTRKSLWGKCIRRCEKKTFFYVLIWTHRNGIYLNMFFVVSLIGIACFAKMNECLTILFYLFFFIQNILCRPMSAKLQIALKKLNSRGKTTWAILFRNFSHKTSNPPEHILCAFSAKKLHIIPFWKWL